MNLVCLAKELFRKELKINGEYVWKNNFLYCLTQGDFLLCFDLDKQSFGYFALQMCVLPLAAPICFDGRGEGLVPIGCIGVDVCAAMLRSGLIDFSERAYYTMRTKNPEQSYSICADMIKRYVNPYFAEVHTIQDYYDKELSDMQRAINRSVHKHEYPYNCAWYNAPISAKAYVLAFVGDYEHALSYMELSNKNCNEYTKEHHTELEQAIRSGNPNMLEELFDKSYQDNRALIKDFLQLDLPERKWLINNTGDGSMC